MKYEIILFDVDDTLFDFRLSEKTALQHTFLDFNLPKRTGHEVLAGIRRIPAYAHVPVLIMTSSDSEKDRQETRRLGSNGYFRKPSGLDEFLGIGGLIRSLVAGGDCGA